MSMKTSVLSSSQHPTYRMAYNESMCSRHHYYYINSDVRHHFLSNGHGYFLYLCSSVSYPCGWLCLCTTYSFPIFILCLYAVLNNLFLWIWPCPYFQHAPWLRAVPYIGYLFVYIPWLLHITSQIRLHVELCWINLKACDLFCSSLLTCYYCQPYPSLKITYIYVPRVSGTWLITIFLYPYHTLVVLEFFV